MSEEIEDTVSENISNNGKVDILPPSTELFLKPPSEMMRKFTRFYIEQKFQNAAEAARRAGTTSKAPNHIAHQWLQDPWIKREIERAKELIEKGVDPLALIHEEDVIDKLNRVFAESMENKKYDTALRSVELMGRQIGMCKQITETKSLSIKETKQMQLAEDEEKLSHLTQVLSKSKNISKD